MAIKHWVGGATAVADVWTLTITDTWAANDTIDVTVGNKTLTLTVGSTATPTQVATELTAALNNTSATGPTALGTGYSANFGGQQFPEFMEFTATNPSAGVVALTADTAGIPFTPSEAVVTAGTGDAAFVNTTVATGPNFLDNADNYLDGVLPADNDTLYFDIDHESGGVDCLYGLGYFRTNSIDLKHIITNDWTGQLGLPYQNANGYVEYRQRYYYVRGGSKQFSIEPGLLGNLTAGNLWLDFQDQILTSISISTARNAVTGVPSIFLAGSSAATAHTALTIKAGGVSIQPDDAGTDSTKYFAATLIHIGEPQSTASSPIVTFGFHARMFVGQCTLYQHGGTVNMLAGMYVDATNNTLPTIIGGRFNHIRDDNSDLPSIQIESGGALYIGGGAAFTQQKNIHVLGGTLDLTKCVSYTQTAGDLNIYANSTFTMPTNIGLAAYNLSGCRPSDCTLTLPPNREWSLANVASAVGA